jgi:hypothetical protein
MTRHWQNLKGRSLSVVFGAVVVLAAIANSASAAAQQTSTAADQAVASAAQATSGVPRLFSFSGAVKDASGNLKTGVVTLTFSIYANFEGGTPLWSETQNVQLDSTGHYTALIGATSPSGLPLDLFTSGTARWLGVQPGVSGVGEQARVLLVGMPYALKAADADTLGGRPASAFVLSESQTTTSGTTSAAASGTVLAPIIAGTAPGINSANSALGASAPIGASPTASISGTGTTNFIPIWKTSTTLGNSLLFQNGSAVQFPATGTATALKGFNSNALDLIASAFKSGGIASNQLFRWQAEPLGNNTTSLAGKLSLLFASGTGTPVETGLSISNKGIISFASGQTLPRVTGNEIVTGNVSANQLQSNVATGTAPFVVNSTTQVANLNASLLGGMPASSFATLGANNFVGNQSIIGNVGIGTSSPDQQLTVNGTVDLWNDNRTLFYVDSGVTFKGYVGPGLNSDLTLVSKRNGDWLRLGANNAPIAFWANGNADVDNSPQMVITSAGRVGIGIGTPLHPLDVVGSVHASFVIATDEVSAGTYVTAGADVIADGCVQASGTTLGGTCKSDVRLKKNIQPFSGALDKVVQLQPVSYNWRAEEYPQYHFGSSKAFGLIAQEVEKVFPDMVSVDKDGFKRVNYSQLPYLMLQAIRELKVENDSLRE